MREEEEEEKVKRREFLNKAKTEIETLTNKVQQLENEKNAALAALHKDDISIILVKAAPESSPQSRPKRGAETKETIWNGKKWRKITENVWEEMPEEVIPLPWPEPPKAPPPLPAGPPAKAPTQIAPPAAKAEPPTQVAKAAPATKSHNKVSNDQKP